MHELSIAGAVKAIAERHANGGRVTRVQLRVGHLRQVVPASLEFGWRVVTEGTELEGAELAIEYVPAEVSCRDCGTRAELGSFPGRCEGCGSIDVDVSGGDELLVEEIEIETGERTAR